MTPSFGRTFTRAPDVWVQNHGGSTLVLARVLGITTTSVSLQLQTTDGSALNRQVWRIFQFGTVV